MNEKIDELNYIDNDMKEKVNDSIVLKVNQEEIRKTKKRRSSRRRSSKKVKLDKSKEEENTKSQLQEENKNEKNNGKKTDKYIDNNLNIRDIINNALFSQLSEISVKLLNFNEVMSKKMFNKEGKVLPKIDYVEFTLLNQGVELSIFKKYGFGIYVFFLYLTNLIITFGILAIFGFYYIGCIFFKYYQDLDVECDLFFECDILSLASGVQIRKFRNYYIKTFGKKAFLDKYENFDVIYREYIFSGTIVLFIIFIMDFIYIIYLQNSYKSYLIENPEINNYTLILSGKDLPKIDNEELINDNKNIEVRKNEIMKEIKSILELEPEEIVFTLKLSDYYEKLDELDEKKEKVCELEDLTDEKTDYYCKFCCFCLCFCCCCSKNKLKTKKDKIEKDIKDITDAMDEKEKNEEYNPLYIINFKNKNDYNKCYSKFPHSYLIKAITNIFGQKEEKNIYINKAPTPENIAWQNLEFDKEHDYFKNKFIILGISFCFLLASFAVQLGIEFIGYIPGIDRGKLFLFVLNIIISLAQEYADEAFSDFINDNLEKYIDSWSLSDIKYYSILFNSIFTFINNGIAPFLIYLITDAIFSKEEDDYSNLVSKMFVIIEMDGFGYPMFDLLRYVLNKKGKEMYESTEKMMTSENIDKEFRKQMDNEKGSTKFKLEQTFEKPEMDIGDNYCNILNIYWITMFYLSIYPIGIFQSFLNLLFKYIIEKNFLINVYKRPEYINPHFGFLCFNFFHFGFFLFLLGDFIFFRNEDNKNSFGIFYIIFMVLILLIPFFLLAKLILYIINCCCLQKKENQNFDDIKQKIKGDYKIFNPIYDKEKIIDLFKEFKKDKNLLTDSQFNEIKSKINGLKSSDLFKLQKSYRTPKEMKFFINNINSEFLYDNEYYEVTDEKQKKLYNLLMQLNLISYLEEGNTFKPQKKKIEIFDPNVSSVSLKLLSLQENLAISGAGFFTVYYDDEEIRMAYVDNYTHIKIVDIFNKRVLKDISDLKFKEKIVCLDYFKDKKENKLYLISISLDNKMIIFDLNNNNNTIAVNDIGKNFKFRKDDSKNTFSVSTVGDKDENWIVTSYYYDDFFKIYNFKGKILYEVSLPDKGDCIISLQAYGYTDVNNFIIVRSSSSDGKIQRISLFINNFFIKKIIEENNYYLNFTLLNPTRNIPDMVYLCIIKIKKEDLSCYSVQIDNIAPILPLRVPIMSTMLNRANQQVLGVFTRFLTPAEKVNDDAFIKMNDALLKKIQDNPNVFKNITIHSITDKILEDKGKKEEMIKFFNSDDIDKYNIGNILFWEHGYIIVGTPFDYLDIIDIFTNKKVGYINTSGNATNLDETKKEGSNIIAYNISPAILNPEYGSTFLMRDNKGKIQYIRPTKMKDRLNYRLIKSDEFFNDLADEEKLEHINFSKKFYFYYIVTSCLFAFLGGLYGHYSTDEEDISKNDLITASIALVVFYGAIGICIKGCVYDIGDEIRYKRTCTKNTMYICIIIKLLCEFSLSYWLCYKNKTGIIFIIMFIIIYLVQLIFNFLVYCFKIKFILRAYFLAFLFYQINRLIILIFFAISFMLGVSRIETYVYALILCVVSTYMYMANYFNTLMREITYTQMLQAIFNYPLEWMNLFCCYCKPPKDCIKYIDYNYCSCEPYFIRIFEFLRTLFLSLAYFFVYFIMCVFCCLKSVIVESS